MTTDKNGNVTSVPIGSDFSYVPKSCDFTSNDAGTWQRHLAWCALTHEELSSDGSFRYPVNHSGR